MSEEPLPIDHMDYAFLTQNALRSVIRQALLKAAAPEGLPGEHHFYITFLTRAEGVSVPPDVLARYPEDITIVLQHQYQNLVVTEDKVSVTLSFGGVPKTLNFPLATITRFYDPSVQFLLEFDVEIPDGDEDDIETDMSDDTTDTDDAPTPPEDQGPKVVSLDQFRKK
ncbi:MAG: ClpXP protease specificity-enhancing factor SspB [Asticcacaulis sp.]